MSKRKSIAISVTLVVSVLCALNWRKIIFVLSLTVGMFFVNDTRYSYKYYPNKTGDITITAFIYIDSFSINYNEFIYIIPYKYHTKNIPNKSNIIKFPNGALVAVKWKTDRLLSVFSNYEPLINTMKINGVRVEVIVGRKYINQIERDGGEILPDIIHRERLNRADRINH